MIIVTVINTYIYLTYAVLWWCVHVLNQIQFLARMQLQTSAAASQRRTAVKNSEEDRRLAQRPGVDMALKCCVHNTCTWYPRASEKITRTQSFEDSADNPSKTLRENYTSPKSSGFHTQSNLLTLRQQGLKTSLSELCDSIPDRLEQARLSCHACFGPHESNLSDPFRLAKMQARILGSSIAGIGMEKGMDELNIVELQQIC